MFISGNANTENVFYCLNGNITINLILFAHVNLLFEFGWSIVLLFGQDARSSKSNFIGCFDPNCHVISVVEGMCS